MTNIAMGNGPFIDGLPNLKMMDLSMANCECHNQMVDGNHQFPVHHLSGDLNGDANDPLIK